MTERSASKTAFGVAWLRAAHQLIDDPPRILDDPVVVPLLGPDVAQLMREHLERMQAPGARGLRSHVILRSRYAEEELHAAVERGIGQFVLLGAGLDTFAYRQPEWASALRIFEIDQPASQQSKRDRLDAARIPVPPNVTFVPVDFQTESLESGLRRGGVGFTAPAFFSWLGVTMYLTRDAVDAVFQTIATFPPSSEVVFTFASRRDTAELTSYVAERVAELGEPWLSYFEPAELEELLARLGFSRVSFLTPDEAATRYFNGRSDGLPVPRHVSVGRAIV
jgi:methyltransferase (TIGR00027 family)